MNGTFPAVWLAHIGFGMSLAIYILRNYMATLPKTVIESAKIDGASHFQTFFRLILPMSVPGAGVVRDLPVPLGVERPAGRAGVHRSRRRTSR